MLFSDVPFATVRKVLLDLGFVEKAVPKSTAIPLPSVAFRHADSDTLFLFRMYHPQDNVSMIDLTGVPSQLDWRGLLSREAFDAALLKASA